MTTLFSFDVFLSHNSKDKPRVRRLANRLKAKGLKVWFDDWQIRPGDDIYLAVEHGLEASRVQLLCLSRAALGSKWVELERSTVLFRDPSNSGRRFIPLLLEDCDLPDTLRRFRHVDFRQEDDAVFEAVVEACRSTELQEEPRVAPAKAVLPPKRRPQAKLLPAQPAAHRKSEAKRPPASRTARPEQMAVLERKFKGHSGWVKSVAVTPDSKWVVSGSDDKTIGIWNLMTGECRARLEGHTGEVNCVSITPGGRRILSASSDRTIRIWVTSTGNFRRVLKGHRSVVMSVVPTPDGRHLFSGAAGDERSFKIWEVEYGQCLKTIRVDQTVWCADVSHDGKLALVGGHGGKLALWDLERNQKVTLLEGHATSKVVYSVKFLTGGRHAVSGSADNTVKLWDIQAGTCVCTFEGHRSKVHAVAVSPDGNMIASTGFDDREIRIWDVKSAACLEVVRVEGANSATMSVAFSPDGSRFVVGTCGGEIHVFRLSRMRRAISGEPGRRYVNAKVVLIGESGVGKTTLAHRLTEDRYVMTDSTHGMNVWRLDLPLENNDHLEREALLWDLAGQEDYRLIHQLFLGDTALALLLVNLQKDDPFAEAGDWLKAVHAAVIAKDSKREVAKLLVATRSDVGGSKVSQKKVDRLISEHGFLGTISTSAKCGDNCSDEANGNQPSALKRLIARHIPWDRLPSTSTPRFLADIKNAVMGMRDRADIRLLRFSELAQRLESALPHARFGEPEVRTAVTLLANHGLVQQLKFGDLVLLRPDLLNGYASAIIRAARAHKDEIGCVSEETIYGDDFDFTGVERLKHRPDEELLLRALVQTLLDSSFCIRECEGGQWLLVFPSQYRRDRDIPRHPDVFVTYNFTGELQDIYTTLVVRLWYSRTFRNKELWQNAAEFSTTKGHVAGILMEKLGDGQARLSLFFDQKVPDELKVLFIEFVHQHLDRYGRDLKRERQYVCTNTKCAWPLKDIELIRELLASGRPTIICQKCRTEVMLIDHIEQCLGSDPVAKKVFDMDAQVTNELDNQALEQILIGHVQAICGEANQIFRELTKFDYGIDGEVEFKDNDGHPSGQKLYVQLKNGGSHLRQRRTDGKEIFDVRNPRHLKYWVSQPVDVYLVIRDAEEVIRWMNVTRYLKMRPSEPSRQIVFEGEKLDAAAVWRARDEFFKFGLEKR